MRADGRGTGIAAGVAALALTAAAVLFVLRPLALTLPAGGLDSSWMDVLGEAATRPARWGVDLAFTYGPASALITRYFTDGYLAATIPFALALAAVNGVAVAGLARRAAGGRRSAGLLVLAAAAAEAAALGSQLALDQDAFYFALALVLLLLDVARRPGERVPLLAVLAGAALLGAAALAKTSFGVAALGLFAIADARAFAARRRAPLLVPVALAGALAAFLLLGQRLGDLPAYLSLQGEVATGYGEAMYLAAGRLELGAYLVGAAALVAVAAVCGAPGRGGRLAAALGTAGILLLALKAGFVRADVHTQIAWSLLGFAGVALAAGPVLRRSVPGASALAVASLAVLWVAGPLFLLGATDRRVALAGLPEVYRDMDAGLSAETGAWGRFLRDPSGFAAEARAAKAAAWASLRAARPLPALAGGVDILPSEQGAVLANGLDYRPRPSFQEYSTYSPGLIAADAAFYAGKDAPDWVIFGPGGLDDRPPAFTEGALWPELLRAYEPQRRIGDWVALHRRASPLPDVLGRPTRVEASLGERVDLPAGDGPTFARITVRKTLLGRLAAAVFRPPALALRLTLAGGREESYRFIPAMADAGFLLSPFIADGGGFADLAFGRGGEGGGVRVSSFAVGGSSWARLFYGPAVSVELRPVTVPATAPSPEARPLADDLARAVPWRRLARSLARGERLLDGDRLSAPAPTAVTVPVAGASRLRVDFGIADGAWQEGATQGVCFAVRTSPDAPAPLWRRCLDPKVVPADRGPQTADVDLPPGTAAVTAETSCPKSCDWGWAYWGGIGPEG